MSVQLVQEGEDVLLSIKVVPGAATDAIVGPLGDRLKIRVASPAEGGRANRSVERLLERELDLNGRVRVESGPASPRKTVRIEGVDVACVRAGLGL